MKLSKSHILSVYLPDTRNVEISRYGRGNLKLGVGVYTYSRPAGKFHIVDQEPDNFGLGQNVGTCPGSTVECEAICYAKRIAGPVFDIYRRNTGDAVPPLPDDCHLLRLHVSGDFDTVAYTENWHRRLLVRDDVTAWAYTRSWRVPELLPALERLRALPNMQLFASMDSSTVELPPVGWRRAWIDGDGRSALSAIGRGSLGGPDNFQTFDGTPSLICPEETGRKPDCESCRYCFDGKRNDVTFLRH